MRAYCTCAFKFEYKQIKLPAFPPAPPTAVRAMVATRRWKCGVCSAKAGDLVCSGCVTQEAERRRAERAERMAALAAVREAAAAAGRVSFAIVLRAYFSAPRE